MYNKPLPGSCGSLGIILNLVASSTCLGTSHGFTSPSLNGSSRFLVTVRQMNTSIQPVMQPNWLSWCPAAARRACFTGCTLNTIERDRTPTGLHVATNTFKPSSVLRSHTHYRAAGADRLSRRVGPRLLRCSGPWSRGRTGRGMWAHLSRAVTRPLHVLPATTALQQQPDPFSRN